jgi:Dyp-type peroxidase family
LYAYRRQRFSRFFFLSFGSGHAREWLRRVVLQVSSGADERYARFRFNVALSARGLAALDLGDDLEGFPREFVQGMAHPERANVLGDRFSDAPEQWEYGSDRDPLDGVAMLYAETRRDLRARAEEIEELLAKYRIAYKAEDLELPADGREHFGFRDGISQPFVRGSGRRKPRGIRAVATGEFVLGYKNAYGQEAQAPSARRRSGTREHPFLIPGIDRVAFGRNGSYLVIRKLEQDVAGFWQYAWQAAQAEHAADPALTARLIAARFVGRWPNGVPLVLSPDKERELSGDLEAFSFCEQDPHGFKCPLGAHMRRANPRDTFTRDPADPVQTADLHRLLRRGRNYGPRLKGAFPPKDDGKRRGLFFIALNANLQRQFEFVQQTWLNSCKFAGLSLERDPLVGKEAVDFDQQPVPRVFTVQGSPVRSRYEGLPKFVTVRGGGYFFLPSLRALNYLCEGR